MALFNGRYQSPRKTDGTINSGGKLYFYDAGTSNLAPVWQDEALSSEHTNPIILDSNGSALVFLGNQSYDYKVDTSDDTALVPSSGPITSGIDTSNLTVTPNLLVNGDFSAYNATTLAPDSWTLNTPANTSAEVTESFAGYSGQTYMKLTSTGVNAVSVTSSRANISRNRDLRIAFDLTSSDDGGALTITVNYHLTPGNAAVIGSEIIYQATSNALSRANIDAVVTPDLTASAFSVVAELTTSSGTSEIRLDRFYAEDVTYRLPAPSYYGLVISNPSANTVDIDCESIHLISVTGHPVEFKNVDVTIDITDANDRELVTENNSTWYKLYLVSDGATVYGKFAADGVDLIPSLINNGKYYARHVGYVYNDSSGDFLDFKQLDDRFLFKDRLTNWNFNNINTTEATISLTVPVGEVLGILTVFSRGSGATSDGTLFVNSYTGVDMAAGASRDNSFSVNQVQILVISAQVFVRCSVTDSHQGSIDTNGFIIPGL